MNVGETEFYEPLNKYGIVSFILNKYRSPCIMIYLGSFVTMAGAIRGSYSYDSIKTIDRRFSSHRLTSV